MKGFHPNNSQLLAICFAKSFYYTGHVRQRVKDTLHVAVNNNGDDDWVKHVLYVIESFCKTNNQNLSITSVLLLYVIID